MRALLLLLALAALAAPGRAQSPALTPGHLQAAEELLRASRAEEMFRESIEVMLRAQTEQNPAMAQMEAPIREFMNRTLSWETLKPEYLRMYAELYTEAELRELTAFYGTEVGRKMLVNMPAIMRRSAEISQKQLQAHLPELMRIMRQPR